MLQKTLLNIEGLGRQLDPDLDLWATAKPFLERWMSEQIGWRGFVRTLRREAPYWASTLPQLPRLVHRALGEDRLGPLRLAVIAWRTSRRGVTGCSRSLVALACGRRSYSLASDSAEPDFWETRYRQGVTPWDAGRVPPRLEGMAGAAASAAMRVLVPGCGSGYEVQRFAERGDDVVGIDFSDAALDAARRTLGRFADRVRKADFFAFQRAAFDVVYERTFLCALPRASWPTGRSASRTLVRAGRRARGIFLLRRQRIAARLSASRSRDLHALLDPASTLIEDEAVPPAQSVPVLAGQERWQVWKRRL